MSDSGFIAIYVFLFAWLGLTWRVVERRTLAFATVTIETASLLLLVTMFAASWAYPPHGYDDRLRWARLSMPGLLLAIVAFLTGVMSSAKHCRGGLSATVLAICLTLLWFPASVV